MWHNLDTNSMAAAIALENRNQDLANRQGEVVTYMREYAAPRKKAGPDASTR